ncbi:DNA binding ATP binding [Melia azedarach]|uniref:DNA binding ATP binding n=1 Tax=Melia azedarach TaxID=155640 RepID=A0ACC1Z049_MELAZ|nr:DNA binding ATP binding [Melia azedarach]
MATPREHIEEFRKMFFIGCDQKIDRILKQFHGAVKYLSAELYSKDVHFLMELIQNAEDNEYPEGVDPSLEFVITRRDITGTGAPATLLVFNNEKGFSAENIESICSVAMSTKKGNRKRGYVGEKGIGFKSVFVITSQPHIFSNGYQIKFNEKPCPHCNLGFIVPEWVEENPSLSDVQKIYGSSSTLPATTFVFPLKPDKVKPVKEQLSSVHPEVLLFLSKIKRISVREDNEDPRLNPVSAITISSETNFLGRKNIDAESYALDLSAKGDEFDKTCRYHMWRQKFPVKPENRVERRMEIDEWVITLAFPFGERVDRGTNSPGVYAFLPTNMVTKFPFIIQADFLLPSSRETILLDDKWNQGILNCVPSAFVNALISWVKSTNVAPVSTLTRMFGFLPVNNPSCPELNAVRESIQKQLAEEDIVPSESSTKQKSFHKPRDVGRLMPRFWDILEKAKAQDVRLKNLSHHGIKVLNSSFDTEEYDQVLKFLGVRTVNNEWYAKCIQSSNLVLGVSEDVYSELLLFIAENWTSKFCNTNIGYIPLIKYVDQDRNVALCSINDFARSCSQRVLCLSDPSHQQGWLIDWNKEFRCVAKWFFMPESTYDAVRSCSKKEKVLEWLRDRVKVVTMTVYGYAEVLIDHLNHDRNLAVAYTHFLYHSFSKEHLSLWEVDYLCRLVPLVDNYGAVSAMRNGVLVPANGSKWAELMDSNPWRQEGYIELGEAYLRPGNFAGQRTPENCLMDFLIARVGASDVPQISPPNAGIPGLSATLANENAFLLLDWIKNLKYKGIHIPEKFLACIKRGSWMAITMNGSSRNGTPSETFFLTSQLGDILQKGSVLVDIPLVDQSFYGEKINQYKEELKTIGVMFEHKEACEFIGKRLLSLAASSSVSRDNAFSILNFIKFLREQCLAPESFIQIIRKGRWLKTSRGYMSPVESVLYDQDWRVASQISDIPFIDQNEYGEEILCFKMELHLLGVMVGFNQNYQLVVDYLKLPSAITSSSSEAVLLLLACFHHSNSSEKLFKLLRDEKWLKTNVGYKTPGECFLSDPEWSCLLEVFNGLPMIDQKFYGSNILSWKKELKDLGVVMDFEGAVKAFVSHFKQQASLSSISKDHVLSFLSSYRQLKGTSHKFPLEFKDCLRQEKWLRTRLGDCRSPGDCILFGPDWESISPFTLLPVIDDSDRFYGQAIHEYKKELKKMGVVVELGAGVNFVAAGFCIPRNPCNVTSANVLSLLKCIRILQEKNYSLPDSFHEEVSQEWLKTSGSVDFSSPNQCLLFDSMWESYLKQTDGPFIDEVFYGSEIKSYRKELGAIGVNVDIEQACTLLARHLDFHNEFATIVRIYNFLAAFKWVDDSEAARMIWIPDGNEKGQWARPGECVLHDKDGLFSSQLNVLDKYYDRELLGFFSRAFSVKSNPSLDDYFNLWNVWEQSRHKISYAECCAFWVFVVKKLGSISKTEKLLADSIVKLPVNSGPDGILLFDKCDVFIADDLQLKHLFQKSSPLPIFVWYPQPSLPALPLSTLLELYRKIGVRTISKSREKEELSLGEGLEPRKLNQQDFYIGKGLVRLILGFLADPSIQFEAAKRHEAVESLLNLTIWEIAEPIKVRYSLSLSSGKPVEVATQMIRWDRENRKLFTQKIDRPGGNKKLIEYATRFSETISKGILWEREDYTNALSELIRSAFLVEFEEEAVEFLMESKNLQIFTEDEEFLSAAFP